MNRPVNGDRAYRLVDRGEPFEAGRGLIRAAAFEPGVARDRGAVGSGYRLRVADQVAADHRRAEHTRAGLGRAHVECQVDALGADAANV